uniref:Zmp:0000001301 n=1 Tax=Oryzias latipes TaxID=8090 RepID=A0A3P9I1B3_ORYLA
MALASGHWFEKEQRGDPPSPHGHALAVAGKVAFLFGGACSINQEDTPLYFNDFYMLTNPDDATWEEIPQAGEVPSARGGHTLSVAKGRLYLFGGASCPDATECLPGVYSFDISLTWERLAVGGVAPRTLRHSSVAVGDNIYTYGGVLNGHPADDLMLFNTSVTWTPVKTHGSLPPAWGQSCALAGDQVFMFGGCGVAGDFCKDLYVLSTDIYLFGGKSTKEDGTVTSTNEIHKLSIKMKWKVPLYFGIPPARRHGHSAFILHSHLYVFGGKNEEQDFNDLKVMKLINPSERQPMKEILSEFGLQGISYFTPTKVPNVRYELGGALQVSLHRDFSAARDQAGKMIQTAFALLDQEFQKLEELQEMVERHRSQNEAWLRARAEENDRERKELCRLREVQQEQERLREENINIQKRSEHLLSIMQQFRGM